jgi:hypothetical protein
MYTFKVAFNKHLVAGTVLFIFLHRKFIIKQRWHRDFTNKNYVTSTKKASKKEAS